MKYNNRGFVRVCLVSGLLISLVSFDCAWAQEMREQKGRETISSKDFPEVTIERCDVEKKHLYAKKPFQIGDTFGSVVLVMKNRSGEKVAIGDDFVIKTGRADGDVDLIIRTKDEIDAPGNLAYSYGANRFTYLVGDVIYTLAFTFGQHLKLNDSYREHHEYLGRWPHTVDAGGTIEITQQLITHPDSSVGWVVSPAISSEGRPDFRILCRLGGSRAAEQRLLAMTPSELKAIVSDDKAEMFLRRWAMHWIVEAPGEEGEGVVLTQLTRGTSEDMRKYAARCLACADSPKYLEAIADACFDTTASPDLQLQLYYALTWSPHDERHALIAKAQKHSHPKIAASAKKLTAENKE